MKNQNKKKNSFLMFSYNITSWIYQRITAIIITIYTLFFLIKFIIKNNIFTYKNLNQIFNNKLFQILTFIVFINIMYHVWIGMRDIRIDYIKNKNFKFIFKFIVILWIILCIRLIINILWKI